MEKDDEAFGEGNSYTTEFRQYDPRLGRWKSLDPLMMEFPWMSPYVAFDNNPVYFVDPYGLSAQGGGKGGGKGSKPPKSNGRWKNFEHGEGIGSKIGGAIKTAAEFVKKGLKDFSAVVVNGIKDIAKFIDDNVNFSGAPDKILEDVVIIGPKKTSTSTNNKGKGSDTQTPVVKYLDAASLGLPDEPSMWGQDYSGDIQNARPSDYDDNFLNALFLDITADIWNTFYQPIIDGGKKIKNGDVIEGTFELIMASPGGGKKGGKLGAGKQKMNMKQKGKTPMNNQVQNKQINDLVTKYKLDKSQRRRLHDRISGRGYGYKEIDEIIKNGDY